MRLVCIVLLCVLSAAASAQEAIAVSDLRAEPADEGLSASIGAAATYDGAFSTRETGALLYGSRQFSLEAVLSIDNDGAYAPMHVSVPEGQVGDNYFFIDAGGLSARSERLSIRAGRLPQLDVIASPYSLFVNGAALPADIVELAYDDGRFFFETRWIGLNLDSSNETTAFPEGYPDRGANLKTYGYRVGDMSFGLQDAAVYSARAFDFDYFMNPLPSYFVQYADCLSGRPWSNGHEDNTIVGAFWRWDRPGAFSAYAQLLVDDFNVGGLFDSPLNPWKMAWSLGGSLESRIGKLGLYHAGATKYCFEPTYETEDREYGYTYYPDTTFMLDGDTAAIPFEDMMVGYRHGENNLALMATWAAEADGFELAASLELTVSGSKSPANAWHESTWTDYSGTKLLDESLLEQMTLLAFSASRAFGPVLAFVSAKLGYVFNELELVDDFQIAGTKPEQPASSIPIWKPSEDDRPLYSVTVGGRVTLGL